jgi:hypothetical protein
MGTFRVPQQTKDGARAVNPIMLIATIPSGCTHPEGRAGPPFATGEQSDRPALPSLRGSWESPQAPVTAHFHCGGIMAENGWDLVRVPGERGPQVQAGADVACTFARHPTQQPRPSRGEKGIAGAIPLGL